MTFAADNLATTHHLPDVLQALRESYPDLRLTLKELSNPNIEAALIKQEADVAVAVLHRKTGAGLKTLKLVDLPLAIAAPETSSARTFREICAGSSGELLHPLISLPKSEPVAQIFLVSYSDFLSQIVFHHKLHPLKIRLKPQQIIDQPPL